MKTLKQIINRYLYRTTCILGIVILLVMVFIQIITEHNRAYEDATRTIAQIKSVLKENQNELTDIKEEYRNTCLKNAETVACIIEGNPEVLDDIDELKEIAKMVEVDEIHIFDETGRIFTGTHPEYYNLTFDSGEQIGFFKPMLNNKNMKLVQDITPNTAEEKAMQYSAVWSESGKFIVQVGMEPVNVEKVTKKNELSYIFSLFRVNTDANYYAIDAKTGEIVGSSNLDVVGMDVCKMGFNLENMKNDSKGFHIKVNGEYNYCVFEKVGLNYIGTVISAKKLYQGVVNTSIWIFVSLFILVLILARAVVRYMNKYVVDKISDLNVKLKSIADGNLEEKVDIKSSVEFANLSDYVNYMVKSLLENNKKMSYVLSKTNMFIGTYEYGDNTKKVHYTEYIPQILSLDNKIMEQLSQDVDKFKKFIWQIMENPVPDEKGIYQHGKQYLRIEEIKNDDGIFGVAVDVTSEMTKRIKAEKERDVDILTGLYNRRGMDIKLEQLFDNPDNLKYSAIAMIDADGLKGVNDTYGHEKGDIYLKGIANAISGIESKKSVVSRQGGDEFVLFLYGYDSDEEIQKSLRALEKAQTGSTVMIDENTNIPLRFSFGYCMVDGKTDYHLLLTEADKRMYKNKLERKNERFI